VYFEVNDLEYQPIVELYTPGYPATYWEPGEGSEVALKNVVRVFKGGELVGVTTWGWFVLDYAASRHISILTAERGIEEAMLLHADEAAAELDDDFDDSYCDD